MTLSQLCGIKWTFMSDFQRIKYTIQLFGGINIGKDEQLYEHSYHTAREQCIKVADPYKKDATASRLVEEVTVSSSGRSLSWSRDCLPVSPLHHRGRLHSASLQDLSRLLLDGQPPPHQLLCCRRHYLNGGQGEPPDPWPWEPTPTFGHLPARTFCSSELAQTGSSRDVCAVDLFRSESELGRTQAVVSTAPTIIIASGVPARTTGCLTTDV